MAKIEDIDIRKPFAFFETKLEITSYRVFDGSDTQLILNNEDRDIFYNLIRDSKELRHLIGVAPAFSTNDTLRNIGMAPMI